MTDQPTPSDPPEPAPSTEVIQAIQHRNWTRTIFGVVGAIVLLIGLGWIVGAIADSLDVSEADRALAEIQAAPDAAELVTESSGGAEGVVHWSPSLAQAVLVAKGLPDIDEDEQFFVWYADDESAAHAATFTATAGAASVLLGSLWNAGETIEVTVEPRGGSSSGQPVGDVVLRIPTDAD